MRNALSRRTGPAAFIALGAVVVQAHAAPPRVARQIASAPLITLSFKTASLPDPVLRGTPPETRSVATVNPPQGTAAWLHERTRLRSDRTRVAFYPVTGSGLHVSGGSQLHTAYHPTVVALDNRDAIRLDPRRQNGPVALAAGYDRNAPTALVGYDEELAPGMRLGIDAGAMRGRVSSMDAFTATGGDLTRGYDDMRNRVNPVVDLTLNYAF